MGTFWEMVNQQDPNRQRYSADIKEETKAYPEFEVIVKHIFNLVRLKSYSYITTFSIFIT